MGNEIIKIGILGCANIAKKSVIPAIKSLSDKFELLFIASLNPQKAKDFATEFNCQPMAGYDALIDSNKIDAVYIPLPTGLHKEWVNKAILSGKHVYAEKSLAYSYSDATEMVEHAKNNELALMEGFMFLYHSQHDIVFKLLREGKIGEIRHFSSSFGFPPLDPTNFRYSEKLGGGALLDAAGYTVRSARFILGDQFEIKGATLFVDSSKGTNVYGSAFMTNSNGTGASLAFGFDNFYQCRYEIWGQKGKIIAERAFTPPVEFSPRIIFETQTGIQVIKAEPDNHFVHAFEEFYHIIGNKITREKHYADILKQSHSLDLIRHYSNITL
ncbi:MAG: Gfo/Idh/MocA family oxidoreductase [Bacteroidales bacterium]|nr:Gfo/Idh/MocA family oxidoreductase [Bacteroidales bacterium]